MDAISNLATGFYVAISLNTLLYCFLGVTIGMVVGVLPGIGPLAAIAMLLPLSYHLEPTSALVMLAGVHYGSQYGGSTASILLNLPGSPSAAVVCLDGYPMAQKGRAGAALVMTAIASFVGSCFGVLLLSLIAPTIAVFAVKFGAADYFALMVLGLLAAATLGRGSPLRAVAMVAFGLMLGMTGTDVMTGQYRFIYGTIELAEGFSLVAVAMGIFGISEILANAGKVSYGTMQEADLSWRALMPTKSELLASWKPMLRGTGVGAGLGALPGAGPTIASFMAYAVEKRISKNPSRFGKGAIEGVTAPEAANNSASLTAFAPTLTLGIPGDAVMALLLGALMIHGITPGPSLIAERPDIFWGLIVSFLLGNLLLLVLNIPLVGIWVRLLTIPYQVLYPSILVFVCVGVYSANNSVFDVFIVMVFGIIGYFMRLLRFEPAPLLLGFVLGPLMEENLRRALILSRGDLMILLEKPFSATFLLLSLLIACRIIWVEIRQRSLRKADVRSQQ